MRVNQEMFICLCGIINKWSSQYNHPVCIILHEEVAFIFHNISSPHNKFFKLSHTKTQHK
ncbi:unnamed protein product [Spodoptera exigua]|nr:unnamed protein product [Spodoptera exigua]